MIYLPNNPVLTTENNFETAFPKEMKAADPELYAKLNQIIQSRAKYHQWVKNAQKNASLGKEEWMHNLNEVSSYLENATNFMEVLCKKAQGPLVLKYQTSISPNVANFESMGDNHEITATIEVIWARLGMVFAALQNCSYSLGDLNKQLNVNMEKYNDDLKHCLTFVSYAGVRMAKLNYLKKYLLGVFGTGNHQYAAVCELNYHILEAIYLMIEVSYTSLFLLKILTTHDNSLNYLKLIPSLVHHGKEKNDALREIFSTLKTNIQDDVINFFYTTNQEFFDVCGYLCLWCQHWYVKAYVPERDRSQEQVDYDLMAIGQVVLQKLDTQSSYFGSLCKAKFRNTILYHVMNMSDQKHVFSINIKRNTIDSFEMEDGKNTEDRIRHHFATECVLTKDDISDC